MSKNDGFCITNSHSPSPVRLKRFWDLPDSSRQKHAPSSGSVENPTHAGPCYVSASGTPRQSFRCLSSFTICDLQICRPETSGAWKKLTCRGPPALFQATGSGSESWPKPSCLPALTHSFTPSPLHPTFLPPQHSSSGPLSQIAFCKPSRAFPPGGACLPELHRCTEKHLESIKHSLHARLSNNK